MRIAFGLLGLVVVLAVVGLSVKRALQASSAPASVTSLSASDAATRSPQAVTRKVAVDVGQLMQQAASRAEGGDR